MPDTPRTNQPTITDGEIWDIEVVGNIAYVAGTFTSIRQPNNGATIAQPTLAAYNWSTGQVLTTFRPTFTERHGDVRSRPRPTAPSSTSPVTSAPSAG